MNIERSWINGSGKPNDPWKEIDEKRAAMDLANAHGDDAVDKLKAAKALETRFALYRIVE